MKQNTIPILLLFLLIACVPSKKYKTLEAEYFGLKNRFDNLQVKSTEDLAKLSEMESQADTLKKEIKELKAQQISLQKRYDELGEMQNKLKSASQSELTSLLKKLQANEEALKKKEAELLERNKKLIELQAALTAKEQSLLALRTKMSNALLGFEGKGLTIHQKNGKVYVSMDEKLLFKSGSYDIEPAGIKALKEIAKVLEQNPEIHITIEGHTDNVPFSGTGVLSDNWDLSVKRATSVLRELMKGSQISPDRIEAAGKGEYAPLMSNDTKEGKQKNRRTEIILTPKLNELLQLLENN